MRLHLTIKRNGVVEYESTGTTNNWQASVNAHLVEYQKSQLQEKIEQAGGLEEYLQSLPDIKEEEED